MEQQISVTIGIPIYNVESCIRQSLYSALKQSYNNIEYILVDDCGVDNSIIIAKEIIDKSPRKNSVRIITHKKNMGLGEARNTIIRESSSDYIFFMDSDDTISADCIELLVTKALYNNSPDVVVAGYKQVLLSGKSNKNTVSCEFSLVNKTEIMTYLKNNSYRISSTNKLYKREFLNNNDIKFIHRFHEDYYFSLQELYYSKSILIIPEITYNYILREDSITQGYSVSETKINRLLVVQQDLFNYLKGKNIKGILYVKYHLNLISYILFSAFKIRMKEAKNIFYSMPSSLYNIKYLFLRGVNKKSKLLLLCQCMPKRLSYYLIKSFSSLKK